MRAKSKNTAKPATIDDYLAPLPDDQRGALQKLRKTIRAAAPGVEECISYGMPGFRYDGRMLVWFGAGAKHCAFYPGGVVQAYLKELDAFETSKGTIRFQPDRPLPAALVKKIVKDRIAGNVSRSK